MPDRDQTLLPLPGWADVLEQLSLPLRSYQRQLMRMYEPALRFGEQVWQAYGGWLRYWERFVYWERLFDFEGSAFEVSDWRAEERTSTSSVTNVLAEGRPALTTRGPGLGQVSEARRRAWASASDGFAEAGAPADTEPVLAYLAWMLDVVGSQLEQLTSSLNRMFDEQLNLLGMVVEQYQAGMRGHGKQAED